MSKATILTRVEAEAEVGLTLGEEMIVMKVYLVSLPINDASCECIGDDWDELERKAARGKKSEFIDMQVLKRPLQLTKNVPKQSRLQDLIIQITDIQRRRKRPLMARQKANASNGILSVYTFVLQLHLLCLRYFIQSLSDINLLCKRKA